MKKKKKASAKRPDAKQRTKTLPLKHAQAASVKGGGKLTQAGATGQHYPDIVITS